MFSQAAEAEQPHIIISLSVSTWLCLAPLGMRLSPGLTSPAPAHCAFSQVYHVLGCPCWSPQTPCTDTISLTKHFHVWLVLCTEPHEQFPGPGKGKAPHGQLQMQHLGSEADCNTQKLHFMVLGWFKGYQVTSRNQSLMISPWPQPGCSPYGMKFSIHVSSETPPTSFVRNEHFFSFAVFPTGYGGSD